MKQTVILTWLVAVLMGCSAQKHVAFTGDVWSYDARTSTVVNADSSLRFTFGNRMQVATIPLYSSPDSLARHVGLTAYFSSILRLAGLENSRVLLYAPFENVAFVELPPSFQDVAPVAITSNLGAEHPYTAWNWDGAIVGSRSSSEMWTNSYVDRKSSCIVVVDKFTYATRSIARVSILQSDTKKARKIGLQPNQWLMPCNVTDLSNVIPLANWVDGIRDVSFNNYRLGNQILRQK